MCVMSEGFGGCNLVLQVLQVAVVGVIGVFMAKPPLVLYVLVHVELVALGLLDLEISHHSIKTRYIHTHTERERTHLCVFKTF